MILHVQSLFVINWIAAAGNTAGFPAIDEACCYFLLIQVAYHGVPKNAYAVFVEALRSHFITRGMVMPLEDQNPAGKYMYNGVCTCIV